MKILPCIYCSTGAGTTRDHIPPRCFFAVMPNPAITVPCCEQCRLGDQRDDEFMRNLFTSTRATEDLQSVKGNLQNRKLRSYQNNPEKILKLHEIVKPTPAGKAFDFNNPVVDRFMERVSRAVLYDAYQQNCFRAHVDWTHLDQRLKSYFRSRSTKLKWHKACWRSDELFNGSAVSARCASRQSPLFHELTFCSAFGRSSLIA